MQKYFLKSLDSSEFLEKFLLSIKISVTSIEWFTGELASSTCFGRIPDPPTKFYNLNSGVKPLFCYVYNVNRRLFSVGGTAAKLRKLNPDLAMLTESDDLLSEKIIMQGLKVDKPNDLFKIFSMSRPTYGGGAMLLVNTKRFKNMDKLIFGIDESKTNGFELVGAKFNDIDTNVSMAATSFYIPRITTSIHHEASKKFAQLIERCKQLDDVEFVFLCTDSNNSDVYFLLKDKVFRVEQIALHAEPFNKLMIKMNLVHANAIPNHNGKHIDNFVAPSICQFKCEEVISITGVTEPHHVPTGIHIDFPKDPKSDKDIKTYSPPHNISKKTLNDYPSNKN